MRRPVFVVVVLVAAAIGVVASRRARPVDATRSPYLPALESPVRGLTAQEVDDLLDGRGTGYARSAELNGYPGPRHTLDMADHLALTPDQRTRIDTIFATMQAEAKRLGARIVEREKALSAGFAARTVSAGALRAAVDTLAVLYGRLRATHLAAHLETTARLTAEQIARYNEMRGYRVNAGHAH